MFLVRYRPLIFKMHIWYTNLFSVETTRCMFRWIFKNNHFLCVKHFLCGYLILNEKWIYHAINYKLSLKIWKGQSETFTDMFLYRNLKRYLNLFRFNIAFGFVVHHEQCTSHLENIRNTKEMYVIHYSNSLCNGLKMQTIYIILQWEL